MTEPFTLENFYNRRKEAYKDRRSWEWEDEGKWYAVADYYSSAGEFTKEDLVFARKEGISEILSDVREYSEE